MLGGDGLEEPKVYTVSEITHFIRSMIRGEPTLANIMVRGEISNFSRSTAGHCYLSLKDEDAQLRCVMFRRDAESLAFEVEDGMSAILTGDIDVYPRGGTYQLLVRRIEPEGMGAFYLAFQQLKEKLEAEGLFAEELKRPLPAFPERIGVVTSPTGAAVRDIIQVLRRRYPLGEVVLAPCLVQGEQAPETITEAIYHLNALGDIDVMIVGRGGGSVEDLWCFNDEWLARTIRASDVPVVVAVGHETDFTIADFVADRRAPTPSAAAEIVAPDIHDLYMELDRLQSILESAATAKILRARRHLEGYRRGLRPTVIQGMLELHRRRVDVAYSRARTAQRHVMDLWTGKLDRLRATLDSVSPLATLDRGYSITITLPEEVIVDSIGRAQVGDPVRVMVRDGDLDCEVKDKRRMAR
jgi:exodeoxyribonuclease VII large subunit